MVQKLRKKYSKIIKVLFAIYKKILIGIVTVTFACVNRLPRGNHATSEGLEKIWQKTYNYKIKDVTLYFHTPNWLTEYRARTLLTKEPETIAWLNRMPLNSILYDIGANIGVYSIYAAKVKNAKVFSFEPSFLNLELLFRNTQTNHLENKITIIPLSLSNKNQIENLYMQAADNIWGGAHNSSGISTTQDGTVMEDFSVSSQIAISLDSLIDLLSLPNPDYVKVDVDGLESLVLQGAQKSLTEAEEILIEVDLKNDIQSAEINKILSSLGFIKLDSIGTIKLIENQIWVKKGVQ